jgi:hypothetical protein
MTSEGKIARTGRETSNSRDSSYRSDTVGEGKGYFAKPSDGSCASTND